MHKDMGKWFLLKFCTCTQLHNWAFNLILSLPENFLTDVFKKHV